MNNYLAAIELFGFVAPEDMEPDWDTIEAFEEAFGIAPKLWEPDNEPVDSTCANWRNLCVEYGMAHLIPTEFVLFLDGGGHET